MAPAAKNDDVLADLRRALYDWTADGVRTALTNAFAPDAVVHLAHPFEDLEGAHGWWGEALAPLEKALPDVERRDTIVISGSDERGQHWVGCGGYYTGAWVRPFLGIPPTGQQASMRFHEFFHVVDGRVVEVQALWDMPELMMQAGVWPMGPSLGREWHVPGPATQDGLGPHDPTRAAASLGIVRAMGADMGKHPTEPVDAMNLERYWHPKFSWYGPSGIGTARGIPGFRHNHQVPFLNALPDRKGAAGQSHFFAEGQYVGVTGWPNMTMTVSGDGWLGIAPTNTPITLRSLDFWRIENGLIRENWVLVDLLHAWHQVGVDVLGRMSELVSGPSYDF